MREDEQGPPVRSSEQDLQWAVGHVDAADRAAVARVDEHLTVRDVDAAPIVDRDALAAAIGEAREAGQRAARPDRAAVGRVLRAVGDEQLLTGLRGDESVGDEPARPAPADMIGRALLPDAERG